MFVCVCNAVSDNEIEDAVDMGVTSFEGLRDSLDVSATCGTCECEVKRVLHNKLKSALGNRTATPDTSARLNLR